MYAYRLKLFLTRVVLICGESLHKSKNKDSFSYSLELISNLDAEDGSFCLVPPNDGPLAW